jgi:hypothetical protein
MGMGDLELARSKLDDDDLTLVIVKGGRVLFETGSRGISGFLCAVESLGDGLEGSSVADKVVGKAVALLCVYCRVIAVSASVFSERASRVLKESGVHVEWGSLVESVLDRDKEGLCPFEEAVAGVVSPLEAYRRLRSLRDCLKQCV